MTAKKFLLGIFFIFGINSSYSAPPSAAEVDQSRVEALAWLTQHQNGDGSWGSTTGDSVRVTSEVLLSLTNAGITNGFLHNGALAYLQSANAASVDSLARKILALANSGSAATDFSDQLNSYQNGNNAWGAYPFYGSSLPDTPLAVLALLETGNFDTSSPAVLNTLCKGLLYGQLSDNSFSYSINPFNPPASQAQGGIVPTAYAVLALDAIKTATGFSGVTCFRTENGSSVGTAFTISTVINDGLSWIASKQNAVNGGFGDSGSSNVLHTTIAYKALNALASTTYATELDNALGYLVAQQNSNGSWVNDPLLTSIAAQTLPTLAAGTLVDSDSDGVPDDVELFLNRDPIVADRDSASGNGVGVIAINYAEPLSNAVQFVNYSDLVSAQGGTQPYSWSIIAGFLPDGLTLDMATANISGQPTIAGTFNFTYNVVDANGDTATATAQITVAEPEPVNVPILPLWAAVLLMLALAISATYHRNQQH